MINLKCFYYDDGTNESHTVCCTVNYRSTQCKNPLTIWENENLGSTKLYRFLMYKQALETKERSDS